MVKVYLARSCNHQPQGLPGRLPGRFQLAAGVHFACPIVMTLWSKLAARHYAIQNRSSNRANSGTWEWRGCRKVTRHHEHVPSFCIDHVAPGTTDCRAYGSGHDSHQWPRICSGDRPSGHPNYAMHRDNVFDFLRFSLRHPHDHGQRPLVLLTQNKSNQPTSFM
jgi:hypothetical protein